MNYTQRISIETPTRNTVSTFGSIQTSAWTTFLTTGANVRMLSSKESIKGSSEMDVDGFMFEIRMTTQSVQINDSQRITMADGSTFDISDVDKWTLKFQRKILIKAIRRS